MLQQFFKFFGILVGLIVLAILAIVFLPMNDKKFLGVNPLLGITFLLAYIFFVGFLFFYLPGVMFNFKPETKNVKPGQEVKQDILAYFNQQTPKGAVFQASASGNDILVTWSGSLANNQIVDIGNDSRKKVFRLRLDESSHYISITDTETNFSYNLSASGSAHLGFSYFQGIALEYSTTYKPSFELANGKPQLQINKLKYDSNQIYGPIRYITSRDGWGIKFLMVQNSVIQNIFLIIGIIILLAGTGLYFLAK